MKFRPLGDRVAVLPLDESHKIEGFQLPDSAIDKEVKVGIVMSVGRKVEEVKAGDRVVFGAYAGIEMLLGTEMLMEMREGEIMGVLDE
jgi:chaperonin GroES